MTPGDDTHLLRDRAESFGRVAELYDAKRPPYPDALITAIATLGGTDVLDVGTGTGIAARQLSAVGMRVLGVEVDPAMAEVARQRGVEVEVAPFETWDDAGRRFDVVTSAQAWHWVDPEAGARKAAHVLRPGGSIAMFWNLSEVDEAQYPAVQAAYAEHAPELQASAVHRRGHPTPRIVDGLRQAGFADPVTREFPWHHDYPISDYLQLLSTYSDHHLLPLAQRAALLAAIADAAGPTVRLHLDAKLATALWQG